MYPGVGFDRLYRDMDTSNICGINQYKHINDVLNMFIIRYNICMFSLSDISVTSV